MTSKLSWPLLLGFVAIALALVTSIRSDLAHLRWVSELSMQGDPAPAKDSNSPTGYVLGQRQFLGTHERGETYRWIAALQDFLSAGFSASPTYKADTVPTGRPQLLPKLYTSWLGALTQGRHIATAEPLSLTAEQIALWEPLILHILVFVAATGFIGLRYGPVSATLTALFLACSPLFTTQFIPGVLTARTWALFLATYTIALSLSVGGDQRTNLIFSVRAAIAASLALWLDPAFGFPAVVISGAVGAVAMATRTLALPALRWSLIGSALTFAAWLIDGSPWDPVAGELRYVHPWYALAWLGIGLALDGGQYLRVSGKFRKLRIAETTTGALLMSALVFIQLRHGYKGWLYVSASMRRLTSLDETVAFTRTTEWIGSASGTEIFFTLAPACAAAVVLVIAFIRRQRTESDSVARIFPAAIVLVSVAVLSFFAVRWGVVVTLVSLTVLANFATQATAAYRRTVLAFTVLFILGLIAWGQALPTSFRRPTAKSEPGAADLDALVYRHFSHWLASHTSGQDVSALAPPDLSDSLVFHGGKRALMSTAWESFPGHLAASRVLSAHESSEADAVIQSQELTHIILPSWDKVLPLLVQTPKEEGTTTLFTRLQRWVHPPFLRPMPYRLPPIPAYAGQKLVVFKVTPPQDEALSLSRLAEYFVEMERGEPATLVAQVLAQSYPDDPNATITRATVYAYVKNQTAFNHELSRLAADAAANKSPFSWDRRVQRAIILALGRHHELARKEVEGCLASASRSDLFELTPLQAYRLHSLAKTFRVTFPDPAFSELLASLGSEYLRDEK